MWGKSFNALGDSARVVDIAGLLRKQFSEKLARSIHGLLFICAVAIVILFGIPVQAQVTTAQYNNARTGANVRETVLTPRNVNAKKFGKLFSIRIDGAVFAQPLYLPQLRIPGKGVHNVVFIVTEHDSVYAFDADHHSAQPLWHTSFIHPDCGVTTLSSDDVQCPDLGPEIGITSTPVIDATTGTMYLIARTKEHDNAGHVQYAQRLHALDVTTGKEKPIGPVLIRASVDGTIQGRPARLDFDPLRNNQRSALLLANGRLYIAWASSCDMGNYHGWMLAYDAATLKQLGIFNASPDTEKSGIWQSEKGIASDRAGNVFVSTGNGIFNAATGGRNYGDSVLKLKLMKAGLMVRDYFTPFDNQKLYEIDRDLGSGGPILLPDQPSAHPHLLAVAGKGGTIYLIDRDKMGKFHADNDSHAVQTIHVAEGGAFGSGAYWNQHLYYVFNEDYLKDFAIRGGKLSPNPVNQANMKFHYPGATPTISASGSANGIVWVVASRGWETDDRPAVLHAFDAANVQHELYNSEQNSSRDRAGTAVRFTVPTVANGHVYLGTATEVEVYGQIRVTGGPTNRRFHASAPAITSTGQ